MKQVPEVCYPCYKVNEEEFKPSTTQHFTPCLLDAWRENDVCLLPCCGVLLSRVTQKKRKEISEGNLIVLKDFITHHVMWRQQLFLVSCGDKGLKGESPLSHPISFVALYAEMTNSVKSSVFYPVLL